MCSLTYRMLLEYVLFVASDMVAGDAVPAVVHDTQRTFSNLTEHILHNFTGMVAGDAVPAVVDDRGGSGQGLLLGQVHSRNHQGNRRALQQGQ
jgi:hypothetical protein